MKNQDDFEQYFTPKSGTPGMDDKFQAFTVKSVDADKRQITGVASAEIIDRDDEVVTIAALKAAIQGYMENPVILASHAHRTDSGKSPVVGKVVSYQFKGKQLYITVEFADTELGSEYWKLYRDKFQRAFSIGFRVFKSHEEHRDNKRVRIIDEIELYEISCVAVPANPAALSKAKSFVAAKRLEREQKRILDNPDLFEKLLDRYEKLAFEGGDIPADSDLWGRFSAAEKQILLELQSASVDFGELTFEGSFGDDFQDGADAFVEDYGKTIVDDSGAFEDEPDYLEFFV